MPQQRFDHRVVYCDIPEGVLIDEEEEGWELVAATEGINPRIPYTLFFKRPYKNG